MRILKKYIIFHLTKKTTPFQAQQYNMIMSCLRRPVVTLDVFKTLVLIVVLVTRSIDLGSMIQTSSSTSTSSSITETTTTLPIEEDLCHPSNFRVVIKSGARPKYRDRRQLWRNSTNCAAAYKAANISYTFLIGLPLEQTLDPNSHNQAAQDTPTEIAVSKALREEYMREGDVDIIPIRDVYDDLHLKTFQILQGAVAQQDHSSSSANKQDDISLVVVHDDEYCADLKVLQDMCRQGQVQVPAQSTGATTTDKGQDQQQQQQYIYGGASLWNKPSYDIQKGFDGSFSPYFNGALYVLSVGLVRSMVHDIDSKLSGIYASHSEDLQVGRWVAKQNARSDTPSVQLLANRAIILTV
mmetsp:Transcript_14412/g.23814  ORF Transcript_14412/g.23814 Transcript_14412/m.23814 type:complete len:354 (+) Transcript_14412:17-1078(+)